jgi:hypothetical protein
MTADRIVGWRVVLAVALGLVVLAPGRAFAHCDGMDGPVVHAARQALDTGNVNFVLAWVQSQDKAEIRRAFEKTLAVRKLSPESRELADLYFFETLVRVHRAGEGAPYTGLKPAGRDLGQAIPAADQAVAEGSPKAVLRLLLAKIEGGIHERFRQVQACRKFDKDDVGAARQYVKAYVEFLHYVEGIYEAAGKDAAGHSHESEE